MEKTIRVKGVAFVDIDGNILVKQNEVITSSLEGLLNQEDFFEREVEITITCKDM